MGGLSGSTTADTNIVQTIVPGGGQIHGGSVWWDGPDGAYTYVQPAADRLRQYKFDRTAGMFLVPNYAQSPTAAASGQPGGILAVSANGTNAGSGIVWAAHNLVGNANQAVRPGILHAYNAQNVTNELWNSEQLSARDSVGNFAKFVPPTVANGKVYLATFSNRLNVYGLLPRPPLAIACTSTNVTLSWPTNGFPGFRVQTNLNLSPGGWFDATGSVLTTNTSYQTTLPLSPNPTFYRLLR